MIRFQRERERESTRHGQNFQWFRMSLRSELIAHLWNFLLNSFESMCWKCHINKLPTTCVTSVSSPTRYGPTAKTVARGIPPSKNEVRHCAYWIDLVSRVFAVFLRNPVCVVPSGNKVVSANSSAHAAVAAETALKQVAAAACCVHFIASQQQRTDDKNTTDS